MSQIYLGVHLQVLLAVVLAVLCYCLVLCCIFCCRKQKKDSSEEKETIFLLPRPADSVTVTLTHSQCAQPGEQQYEELDGDVLEYLSFKSSSSPSEDDLGNLPFDPSPSGPAEPLQSSRPTFPMRRLSTPALPCSPSKASTHGRASLPSLTKLSFVSKSRRVIGRRRTVSGESLASSENSHLTAGANSQQGEPCLPHYGSNSLSVSLKPAPLLHFSLLFNSASGTLVVNILRLSGDTRRGWGVFARVCLPPLHPVPQQTAPRRRSFNQDFISQNFSLEVGSVEQLCTCTLRLAVYSRDFSGLREAALGEVELACDEIEWEPDSSITYTKQLMQSQNKLKKSFSYRETVGRRKSSVGIPRMLGQLLILLQYQSLAQRIKVMVRKAENLVKLTRIPGTPDHYVVINLHQNGKIIHTKETKVVSGPNPIWNAPFLFDLPPGDITKLHLLLEFIVMQGRVYTKNSILGRVMIGSDASDAGQEHWRETCCLGQTETTRWHSIQSDSV